MPLRITLSLLYREPYLFFSLLRTLKKKKEQSELRRGITQVLSLRKSSDEANHCAGHPHQVTFHSVLEFISVTMTSTTIAIANIL